MVKYCVSMNVSFSVHLIHLAIPVAPDWTVSELTQHISEAVNTSFEEEITIVSPPNNGDVVEMSNGTTDFNLVFIVDGNPLINPSTVRKPIFVVFSGSDTTAIAAATAAAINAGVMGVPRAADLGLSFPQSNFNQSLLQYYMVL